jgi:hypothetical protein
MIDMAFLPPLSGHRNPDESLVPVMRVTVILFAAIMLLFLVLRAYSRLVLRQSWGMDNSKLTSAVQSDPMPLSRKMHAW